MPVRLPQLLIVMLLALTVPIQGFAAVAAGVCMALGHHEGGTPSEAASHDAHQHDHGAGGAQTQGDHSSGDSKGTADSHCPPCVSCCAAAAITSFPPLALPERPAGLAVPTLPPLFSGVTLENLDRPPLAL